MAELHGTAQAPAAPVLTPQQITHEMRQAQPKPDPHPTPQQFEQEVRRLEQKKPPVEPFEWATPERIRQSAMSHPAPAKKQQGWGMTNAQIIRALRKGKK
jgi:hypothetical protein